MRTFSVVDFLTSPAAEENFIQPQTDNDKKMGKLMEVLNSIKDRFLTSNL